MSFSIKPFINLRLATTLCAACLCLLPSLSTAQDAKKAPDLDLTIKYFNRELTPEGVQRESSYQEKMLRRSAHVWSYRVLPEMASAHGHTHQNHEHKEFNHIVLPRLVKFDGNKTSVEFINVHDRQVINIVPTEYENVNFDGSWINTYYLIDPKIVASMPLSQRPSSAASTRWHEIVKNGMFQRVLWDEKQLIPLLIETGDLKNTFFQRITVTPDAKLTKDLPWSHLQGYAQKEYSDFLD